MPSSACAESPALAGGAPIPKKQLAPARRQNRHIPQTSSYLHRVTSMLTVRITSPSEEMMIRFATESAKGRRSLPTLRVKRSMKTWNQNK
jgi:hypothetical protein